MILSHVFGSFSRHQDTKSRRKTVLVHRKGRGERREKHLHREKSV